MLLKLPEHIHWELKHLTWNLAPACHMVRPSRDCVEFQHLFTAGQTDVLILSVSWCSVMKLLFYIKQSKSTYIKWKFWGVNMWDIQCEHKILGCQQDTAVELMALCIFAGFFAESLTNTFWENALECPVHLWKKTEGFVCKENKTLACLVMCCFKHKCKLGTTQTHSQVPFLPLPSTVKWEEESK